MIITKKSIIMIENLFDPKLISQLLVSIGDVSDVTGIPQRKLRYWEDKGIITSSSSKEGGTRKFDYVNIKKILLIKELLDEGFTLDASVKKIEERIIKLKKSFAALQKKQE
jgi:MerR family transcriptional regulator, global nitrogen regulator